MKESLTEVFIPAHSQDLLPPSDDQAEAGALGCVLAAEPGEAERLLVQLDIDYFYDLRHKNIFSGLTRLRADSKPLNCVALAQHFKDQGQLDDVGGLEYLRTLPDQTPSPKNFPTFLETVRGDAARRAILADSTELGLLSRDKAISMQVLANAATRMFQSYTTLGPRTWAGQVQDAAEICAKEYPPLVQIIQGIVAEKSKLVIGSSAKSFKTFLTMDAGLSIAHGVEFLGRPTVRKRVLYVNLELKAETFGRRVKDLARAKSLVLDPGWFLHLALRGKLAGLGVHEIVSSIMQIAREYGAEVVILDPFYKLNVDGDENSSRDMAALFNELDRLTTEGGCTVILNDHSGKGNQSEKDPLDVLRGSSAKGGDVDAAMILRRHEAEGCFRVDLILRELPPTASFVIGWTYPLMAVRLDLSPDALKRPKGGRSPSYNQKDLLSAVVDRGTDNPISIMAWAEQAGVKRQTLNGYVQGMLRNGWLARVGEGNASRLAITPAGQEAVKHR